MQTGNAGDQTAVAAAGAPASTTAAQRLNGIDRLFSLQGQQPVRTAVTATTPLRPKTTAPEIVPQPTDGPSLAAERSPETRSYAVPQSLLPTQTGQAASPAAPRLSSRSAAPATTQEPAPLNPPTAASRAAVLPPPTGNAPAGMTTGKAFVPVTVDPTATGETASAIGLTPDTAAGSLAAVQTAAVQAQAAKGVGPAHENVDGAVLPEANLHPSTGALNAITAAAVTAAQSGSGADANAGGGPQERSSSGAPQADASQAGISGVAGTASTVESASGATAGTSSTGTPIDNAQVIAQVTRHIETMRLLNGRGEITLQLQPDHLGSVRMTITNHADGVTAHIVTESSQAQQVMQNAGTQLHTALEARGLRLTAFDVSVGNGAANAGAGHGTPQDTPQDRAMRGFAGTRNSGRNLSAIDEVNAAAPDPVSPGGAGTLSTSSRLDYRA
jgi:flagellar hook-length control protein FliK